MDSTRIVETSAIFEDRRAAENARFDKLIQRDIWVSRNRPLLATCAAALPCGVDMVAMSLAVDAKTPLIMTLAELIPTDCLTHVVDAYFNLIMHEIDLSTRAR